MASVNFSTDVGGDGSILSDDADPVTGLKNYGWASRFVPALAQLVAIAQRVLSLAQSAINAPGTSATSTTSLSVTPGTKTLVIQTGKAFVPGQWVTLSRTSNPTGVQLTGPIAAHNSGTGAMDVDVKFARGTGGPYTDWTIALAPQSLHMPQVDKGTVGTGTVTFDVSASDFQRLQVGGALTIATSGWPAAGVYGELLFELVNGASATITWGTINWIKADGSTTTTFASNGVTLQTAGTDWVYLWTRDGGTTVYGKIVR